MIIILFILVVGMFISISYKIFVLVIIEKIYEKKLFEIVFFFILYFEGGFSNYLVDKGGKIYKGIL